MINVNVQEKIAILNVVSSQVLARITHTIQDAKINKITKN